MATRRNGPVVTAVRRDLRRLPEGDRAGALAAQALKIALILDEAADAAEVPAAARELRITMTELLKLAPKARSGIDEIRARRAKRAEAAG